MQRHTAKTHLAHGKGVLHGKEASFAVQFAFAVCNLAFFFLFYFIYFKTYIDYLNMTNVLHLYYVYTNTFAIRQVLYVIIPPPHTY